MGWSLTDEFFPDEIKMSPGGVLSLGGSPHQQILLAADLTIWGSSDPELDLTRVSLLLSLQYYPTALGGFFVHGGAGLAARGTEQNFIDTSMGFPARVSLDSEDLGLGLGAGAGYDVQLGRNFFLTPIVHALAQHVAGEFSLVVLVGLGATWH